MERLLVLIYDIALISFLVMFITMLIALEKEKVVLFKRCIMIMLLIMLLIITLAPMAGGLTLEESYKIIINK